MRSWADGFSGTLPYSWKTISSSMAYLDRRSEVMVNVWRLMAHHVEPCRPPMIQWATANNRIAIGWGDVGCLAQYATPEDIQKEVRKQFRGQGPPGEKSTAGIQLWNFRGGAHSFYPGVKAGRHQHDWAMQCEDLVILKGSGQDVVMRVTGAYEYAKKSPCLGKNCPGLYQHQRKAVHMAGYDPGELWEEAGGPAPCQDIRGNALLRGRFPKVT